MKILNNNQQLTVHVCLNFKNRFLGMMGQKKEPNYGLFFPHCHSIHTCFMKFPIDIYIVDYNNTIIFCKKKQEKNWLVNIPPDLIGVFKEIDNVPRDINYIARKTKLPISEVNYKIMLLQLEEKIIEKPGHKFVRNEED